jgi:hypothetical protein
MRKTLALLPINLLKLTLLSLFLCLPACATDNEFNKWSLITLDDHIDEHWWYYFELQNRVVDNMTQHGVIVVRPGIGYDFNENFGVLAGYTWKPNFRRGDFGVFRDEHNVWEQLHFSRNFDRFSMFGWTRFEHRFIEGAGSTVNRLRVRLGTRVPYVRDPSWRLVVFDELFVNLNGASNGPNAGFDQNWVFAGVEKMFGEHTSLLVGYIMNHQNGDTDLIQHGIRSQLNFSF